MDIYQRKECLRVLGCIAANDDQIVYIPSLAIFVYRGEDKFYLILPYSKNRECGNDNLAEVTFRTYGVIPNEINVLSLEESYFMLNSERLRKSVEDYITNEFYNRRYMTEEFAQPLIHLLETIAQGDTLSLLKRQATIKLFICKSKNDITVELKPVLTFLRLKKNVNPTIMDRFSDEAIYTYDIEFTTTTSISEHFTRREEYALSELHMVEKEDGNALEDRFVIRDNLNTGIMSFWLKRKDHEWSSRASVVSCIPGYECASILIDNTIYHMHLKNLTQYIPDGYVLVQVHDIYDEVEKEFSIVSVEDMKKYPDKLVPVTFNK